MTELSGKIKTGKEPLEVKKTDERVNVEDRNDIIKVGQTTYDVMYNWMKIMSKYFNLDLEALVKPGEMLNDSEISLLKTGLFGYINEIMSSEVKNAVAHRNVLYDEYFINSATFPESIYKFAKAYNVDISMAQPAHMSVTMAIRKSDIINSPLKKEIIEDQYVRNTTLKTYEIRLDRRNEFSVGKFKFMIPYDVIITLKQITPKEFAITAKYDYDDKLFKFDSYHANEIKVYQDIYNGENYVYLGLDVFQMKSTVNTYTLTNTDDLADYFFTVEHPDQVAGFNVKYTFRDRSTYLKTYFNNTFTPEDPYEEYCYYSFVDDDKLQISFSNLLGAFKPAFGSTLEIEVLSSKGAEGNFNYIDRIDYNINNVDNTTFHVMLVAVTANSSSSGGKDKLDIMDEKMKIINKMTTRDNLIMNRDLENFFENINTNYNVNGTKIEFMKKRDDMLLRVYNAFLLMKDNNGRLVPSTTAPSVVFPTRWFSDNNSGNANDGYVIPEHSIFRYDTTEGRYKYVEDGYNERLKEELSQDKDNMVYVNPFLIRIDTQPILNAYYYKLDINESFNMTYSYKNSNIVTNLVVNQIHITKSTNFKEDLNSDTYTIKLNLNSNEAIQDVDKKIRIRGVLLDSLTSKKYGYFEFEREVDERGDVKVTDSSTYIAHLSTNRKFQRGNLSLADSLYDVDGIVQDDVFINENCIIKIGILYHDPEGVYRGNDSINAEGSLFTDAFPTDVQKTYNINEYVLATTVTTSRSVKLYQNLSQVMTSTVSRVKTEEDIPLLSQDLNVEMIPLIGLEYFADKSNNEYLYSLLGRYIEMTKNIIPRLENSTTVDLKFYNTRGPSRYFYLNTDIQNDEEKLISLNRTDVLLDFTIHVFRDIHINDGLDNQIKKFIADFIEACNEEGIVPISNLIRLLESNFEVIRYIEFNGITGRYADRISNRYQKILKADTDLRKMTKQEVIDYVPEFINVKKQLVDQSVYVEQPDGSKSERVLGSIYTDIVNIKYQSDY